MTPEQRTYAELIVANYPYVCSPSSAVEAIRAALARIDALEAQHGADLQRDHAAIVTWQARAEQAKANRDFWQAECEAAKESRDAACHERDATIQALEQAEAERDRLRAALEAARPALVDAVDKATAVARHRSFAYDVYGLGPHTAATVDPKSVGALAILDAALKGPDHA
jgi:hypothetical protein